MIMILVASQSPRHPEARTQLSRFHELFSPEAMLLLISFGFGLTSAWNAILLTWGRKRTNYGPHYVVDGVFNSLAATSYIIASIWSLVNERAKDRQRYDPTYTAKDTFYAAGVSHIHP